MKFRVRLTALLLSSFLCAVLYANSAPPQSAGTVAANSEVSIPGPLRSFLRMAAISQKVTPDEVLPLLARNVVVNGYQGGKPTEFLVLVNWYLDQARELLALAGPGSMIRVNSCEEAKPLLTILGYGFREPCGPNAALATSNPDRAFITIDSGFPLADLEETLRGGKPFAIPYASSDVPVLFSASDWGGSGKKDKNPKKNDVVDTLLRDPSMARLYWAMSRIDNETALALWQSPGPKKLVPYSAVLDFYGSHISIRGGRVLVPGGNAAEGAWKDLVGASPSAPADFVTRLIAKDDGWLAVYFDALSRGSQAQVAYFTEPRRLQRFYEALRGTDLSPSPTRHSFRPDQGLFLLVDRIQLDSNGQPHVPGDMEVWRDVLRFKGDPKLVHEWNRRAGSVGSPEQLLEALFSLSRVSAHDGAVENFLTLSEIDRGRVSERLNAQTARLLTEKFSRFGDQYMIFSEFRRLNNDSMTRFLTVADAINHIPDRLLRADTLGMFQANVGLWQILARQGQIAEASWNDSLQKVIAPFTAVNSAARLFDAGHTSFSEVLRAAAGKASLSQDAAISVLAGPDQTMPEAQRVHQEIANRMRAVLDDQRLVSLNTIFTLGDGLTQMANGKSAGDSLIPLAGELREFEMPKPLFTTRERSEYAAGLYSNRHIAVQMKTDLGKVIKGPATPNEITDARGQLSPFLRDTLVGLNYAYYEPPGAQMLHHNPLFVRSHDFSGGDYSGETATAGEQTWRTPRLFGRGWTASGGAHLIGSMADLPYVLAKVEQDFIVPQNVQSLIWEDLVPGLVTSAVMGRWWGVSRNELHAVALYQRTGEELLAASAKDEKLRRVILAILSERMLPQRSELIERALKSGQAEDAVAQTSPAETFYLAVEYRKKFPGQTDRWGDSGKELENLALRYPADVSWDILSRDFGVPHPVLAQNYARELLNVKPLPTFLGSSSRLLAESWESNNLYWARLADEMGIAPVMLNRLVPELTRRMVEQTFATHLEDWPAVLRAMRETGSEFRSGKIASVAAIHGAAPGL